MIKDTQLNKQDILTAIKKSGYLLEAEISKYLVEWGFFVESNTVIEDPVTGKSREIDLLAENFSINTGEKAAACIKFAFEIKNNIFPLVLLNKFEFSPNIEEWDSTKEIETRPDEIPFRSTESYFEKLIEKTEDSVFTQYCSFNIKKNKEKELFACHPEQLYSGLVKLTQYCEENVSYWEDEHDKDNYFRKFIYLPVY